MKKLEKVSNSKKKIGKKEFNPPKLGSKVVIKTFSGHLHNAKIVKKGNKVVAETKEAFYYLDCLDIVEGITIREPLAPAILEAEKPKKVVAKKTVRRKA